MSRMEKFLMSVGVAVPGGKLKVAASKGLSGHGIFGIFGTFGTFGTSGNPLVLHQEMKRQAHVPKGETCQTWRLFRFGR
jgi:hypothetical protein